MSRITESAKTSVAAANDREREASMPSIRIAFVVRWATGLDIDRTPAGVAG